MVSSLGFYVDFSDLDIPINCSCNGPSFAVVGRISGGGGGGGLGFYKR